MTSLQLKARRAPGVIGPLSRFLRGRCSPRYPQMTTSSLPAGPSQRNGGYSVGRLRILLWHASLLILYEFSSASQSPEEKTGLTLGEDEGSAGSAGLINAITDRRLIPYLQHPSRALAISAAATPRYLREYYMRGGDARSDCSRYTGWLRVASVQYRYASKMCPAMPIIMRQSPPIAGPPDVGRRGSHGQSRVGAASEASSQLSSRT